MKRVRILARVLDQLEEQLRSARAGVTGGLLLGQPGESPWIERVLPCRNEGERGASTSRYVIDPRVVRNVERSLEGKPISILGVYHASAEIGGAAPEPAWIEAGPLWLSAKGNGTGLQTPRVLRRDAGPGGAEVPIEVVRPVATSRVVCPD